MIIDDEHEIAFVHIPKCAGTTVREYLKEYDRSKGKFSNRVVSHTELGRLDYVHIPLFVLKNHFRKEFELVQSYWSFVVVRDPFKRFASSVTQRLKMYGEKPMQEMSASEIRNEVEKCIEYLRTNDGDNLLLPCEYIHFQKQSDYIYVGGERIIKSIYTTDNIDCLINSLKERTGLRNRGGSNKGSEIKLENTSLVYRNDFFRWLMIGMSPLKPIVRFLLSDKYEKSLKGKIYVTRDSRVGDIFSDPYVEDFIREYYQKDIDIFCGAMSDF